MFSILLLNGSQCLNKFLIVVCENYRVFWFLICGVTLKTDYYRGQFQRRITPSRLIADTKSRDVPDSDLAE